MGLLSLGTPLSFTEGEKHVEHVHTRGIADLIKSFKINYDRSNEKFLWGDELEYMLINFNREKKTATLDVEHDYILSNFDEGTEKYKTKCVPNDILYHPEYGRFMVEATPLRPYDGDSISDFLYVEKNMAARRKIMIDEIIDVDGDTTNTHQEVIPLSITAFPIMGTKEFTNKVYEANGQASHSLFLPDQIINRHARFPTLTKNIRTRRGSKVAINVPIYPDTHTQPLDEIDHNIPKRDLFFEDSEPFLGAAKPGHIYMDSMGFGMGCSCLQVTMQAPNIDASRYLYDSLLPITPILLSLSAATPIFKGTLADQDVRWNVISNAVDDRTPLERDVKPMENHQDIGGVRPDRRDNLQPIDKSRYDSISSYLGDYDHETKSYKNFKKSFNDLPLPINQSVLDRLTKESDYFDEVMAQHFAHLFIRDPLVVFSEKITDGDSYNDDHFQNIQSTNWQTLRFKPPTAHHHGCLSDTPGWRVEFRPLEIQITDFENAAYSVFLILLSKAILKYKPNFYIPISLIDENMITAHKRNSLGDDKFWYRFKDSNDWDRLSINEIINGNSQFIGLIPLVEKYVSLTFNDVADAQQLEAVSFYLKLIAYRASGKIPTLASYIRQFVMQHPDYKHDSIVSHDINYDLLCHLRGIGDYRDEKALVGLFGEEIGEYLINNRKKRR
ncbi:glutamate--cysteine ligase [Saccharomycopsis crataegensis]|uniref:Glutamate--cysteine ligase n=1 Tax=Saccharomycopsis crataegensis TaxID=43959 RepID=A0AAV5QW00_9ASCO|nr:glutamate--cysteine ligase [Saccharomycopsis crataegensis]